MVTTQEIVQQQRQAIEQAKAEIKPVELTATQIRQQTGTLGSTSGISQHRIIEGIGKARRKQKRILTKQEQAFESQVSKVAPEQAKPQFLEQSFKEARTSLKSKVDSLGSQIAREQANIKRYREKGDSEAEDEAINELRQVQAEFNVYSGQLASKDKVNVIKGHFSGNTKAQADYKRNVEQARQENRRLRKQFKARQTALAPQISQAEAQLRQAKTPEEFKQTFRDIPSDVREFFRMPSQEDLSRIGQTTAIGDVAPSVITGGVISEAVSVLTTPKIDLEKVRLEAIEKFGAKAGIQPTEIQQKTFITEKLPEFLFTEPKDLPGLRAKSRELAEQSRGENVFQRLPEGLEFGFESVKSGLLAIPMAVKEGFGGLKGFVAPKEDTIKLKKTRRVAEVVLGGGELLVPTTPLDVGVVFTGGKILTSGSKIIRGGSKLALTGFGTAGALDTDLTPEQRVASGFIGLVGATGLSPLGFSKTTTKPIRLGRRTLEIPTDTIPTKINLLGFETTGGRALILKGKSPSKILTELKKVPDTTEIKLGSALETKAIQRALQVEDPLITARAKDIIPVAQSILRQTGKTKSKFIDPLELTSATERLPPSAIAEVLKISRENKGVLFGSKARAVQLAKEFKIDGEVFKLDKVPRDVELRFDSPKADLDKITANTIKRLKKLGTIEQGGKKFELGTAREIKDTPFAIEIKVNGKWQKAVELKGKGSVIEGEEVPEYVVGFKKTGEPIKVRETELTSLSEELRGVSQGVLRFRIDKKTGELDIFPSPKRVKDIGSVSVSARTLEMSRPSKSLRKDIETFEGFFPKELVREQVRQSLLQTQRRVIADFSTSATSRGLLGKASPSVLGSAVSKVGVVKALDISPSVSPGLNKRSPSVVSRVTKKTFLSPSVSPVKSPVSKSPFTSISPSSSPSPSPVSPSPFSPSPPSPSPPSPRPPSPSPFSSSPPSETPPSKSPFSEVPKRPKRKTPKGKLKLLKKKEKKKKLVKPTRKPVYQGQTKKAGRWVKVGGKKTQSKAFKSTLKHVDNKLRASFRIMDTRTNKPIPLSPTPKFRRSRSKGLRKTVLVEKAKFRLDKGQEKGDIKKAKRQAPKKKKQKNKNLNPFF